MTFVTHRCLAAQNVRLAGHRVESSPRQVPPLLTTAYPIRSYQTPLRPLSTLDRFPGYGLSYPAGSDNTAIRRNILLKNCLVRLQSQEGTGGGLTKSDRKVATSNLGTRIGTVHWNLSQALGLANENVYALEYLKEYIVWARRELQRKSGQYRATKARPVMSPRLLRVLFVCVLFSLTVTVACAQDIWLGGTGNWSNSADWSGGVPNGMTVDVLIDNGNPVVSVVSLDLANENVKNLTLDSDDSLIIGGGLNSVLNVYNTLTNSGTLTNSRTLVVGLGTLTNSGTLYNSGMLYNFGALNNSGTVYNSGTLTGPVNNLGVFFNEHVGTLNQSVSNSGTLTNSGTWNASDGIDNYRVINNYGMLTYEGLFNRAGATLNNYGGMNNSGFYSFLVNLGGTINNYGAIDNSKLFSNNFGTINNYGQIDNAGTLVIASGASLVNDNSFGIGTYTQSAGSTVVDGLFSSSTAIQIDGGTLSGSGTIQGDVAMGGTLNPGDSPGKLNIQGNYTQLSGGTFFAELAGLAPGTQYDQLAVTGAVALDGTLRVVLLNGLVVDLGDSFVLMTYGSESGQFSTRHLALLPVGEMWHLSYNTNDLTLTAVPSPEPPSTLLLGTGVLAGIAVLRRKLML